jgi:hypothetical protein
MVGIEHPSELEGEAALADAGRPSEGHEARALEQRPKLRKLFVPSEECAGLTRDVVHL